MREGLPERDPFRAWANFEVIDNGWVGEVDLLVLCPRGFYLVEIKSYPGLVTGDPYTWTRQLPEGSPRTEDTPYLGARRKAQRLRSVLDRQLTSAERRARRRIPFVAPLVFLSSPDLVVKLSTEARAGVLGPGGDGQNRLPGIVDFLVTVERARDGGMARTIDGPAALLVTQAMERAGVKASRRSRRVGDLELEPTPLLETELYQDFAAQHLSLPTVRRRVRIYPLRADASTEQRTATVRTASREYQAIDGIHHDGILGAVDYREHELGPAIVFEHTPGAERLSGGTSHTTGSAAVSGTSDLGRLLEGTAAAYLAPETWSQGAEVDGVAADVFGLGALAFHVVAGWPAATSFHDLCEAVRRGGLHLSATVDGVTGALDRLVADATRPLVSDRLASVAAFLERFDGEVPRRAHRPRPRPRRRRPGQRRQGRRPRGRLGGHRPPGPRVERRGPARRPGGRGRRAGQRAPHPGGGPQGRARARAQRPPGRGGRGAGQAGAPGHRGLAGDGRAVGAHHARARPGRFRQPRPLAGRAAQAAPRVPGALGGGPPRRALLPRRGGRRPPRRQARHLGIVERGSARQKHLVLFDFSLSRAPRDNIRAGTRPYLEPFLSLRPRKAWDEAAERYAVTLYEMATGATPTFGDGQSNEEALDGVEATVEEELPDPAVAPALGAFFRRALRRDPAARFDTAVEMRRAWLLAFAGAGQPTLTLGGEGPGHGRHGGRGAPRPARLAGHPARRAGGHPPGPGGRRALGRHHGRPAPRGRPDAAAGAGGGPGADAEPLTVGRLRAWLEEPEARGLPPKVGTLVVATFAEQTNRVVFHRGARVPAGIDLPTDAELRTQPCPLGTPGRRPSTGSPAYSARPCPPT
ncbi:MAG: hypothetical protein GEV08_09930 [Acidimicrobiia bacterium]|nr:hypothetical protein [Acidimicrobiia bacterium]